MKAPEADGETRETHEGEEKERERKGMESIEEMEEEEKMKAAEEDVSDPDSPGRNAQEELANLASALMAAAAAAAQAQDGAGGGDEERGQGNGNNSEAVSTLMMMKPLVKKARKLLYRRMRVGVEDNRVFIGKFHCLDKQGNIILYDTVEYRQISPQSSEDGKEGRGFRDVTVEGGTTEQRSLGLVLIPARCRTSCHVECSLQDQFSLLSI